MEKIAVEFRGTHRYVTRDQLELMIRRGFVAPDADLFVDGKVIPANVFLKQVQSAAAPVVPTIPSAIPQLNNVAPPPQEAKEVALPPPQDVKEVAPPPIYVPGVDCKAPTKGKDDARILMNEFSGDNFKDKIQNVKRNFKIVFMILSGLFFISAGIATSIWFNSSSIKNIPRSSSKVVVNESTPVKPRKSFEHTEKHFTDKEPVDESSNSSFSTGNDVNERSFFTTGANEDSSYDVVDSSSSSQAFDRNEPFAEEDKEYNDNEYVDGDQSYTDVNNEKDYEVEVGVQENEEQVSYDYDNSPLDESTFNVASNYKGCDLVALYNGAFNVFTITKGEYETTRDFSKRRANVIKDAQTKNIIGTITPGSRIAAVFTYFEKQYDADGKKLICTFDEMLEIAKSLAVLVLKDEASMYLGHNALGVEKVVEKAELDVVGLSSKRGFKREYAIPIPIEEAVDWKERVKALVVFTLDPQKDPNTNIYYATYEYYDHIEPKMSLPYDIDYYARALYVKDVEIWFYNDSTGEILMKTPAYPNARPTYVKYDARSRFSNDDANTTNVANDVDDEPDWDSAYENASSETDFSLNDDEDDVQNVVEPVVEELPPVKTWQELLSESVDEQANWEKKKPAIVVPDDAPTLTDALAKAKSGDVVQLKKSTTPYPLGVKLSSGRTGLMLDKPVAIVGETGDPSDVVIEIGVMESVFVETKGAMFKGVTLSCGPLGLEKTCSPLVQVGTSGYATFKYCEFHGNGVERSVGVKLSGQNSRAAFWKSVFRGFGDSGVLAEEESAAKLQYCEFLDGNHYGFTSESGASVTIERCHFADNDTSIHALSGGGGKIVESRFEGNKRRAEISAASRNKFEESDNVYDKK